MATSSVTRSRLGRSFTALWAATGSANLGDAFALLALPLIALQVTTSPAQVAMITTTLTLAWPLVGLHAGMLVDRSDRRRLVIGVNVIRAAVLAALTAALLAGSASIVWVYAVALVVGVCETVADTSLAALIPQVVRRREHLGQANARIEVAQNVTNQLVGPPLAGLVAAAGLAWTTGIGALAFAGTVPILAALRGSFRAVPGDAPARPGAELSSAGRRRPPAGREFSAGLRFIWRSPLLRSLTILTAAMNVCWAAWLAVLVVFAVAPGPVGLTPAQYGLLLTAMAAGGIAGAAVVEPLRRRLGAHRLLALDVIGTVLLVGIPAVTTNPFAIGMAMFVGGAGSAVWRVLVSVVRQSITPDAVLGRVYSASRVMSWGVLPLGATGAAIIAELAGVRTVFAAAGVASLGVLAAYIVSVRPAALADALGRG